MKDSETMFVKTQALGFVYKRLTHLRKSLPNPLNKYDYSVLSTEVDLRIHAEAWEHATCLFLL